MLKMKRGSRSQDDDHPKELSASTGKLNRSPHGGRREAEKISKSSSALLLLTSFRMFQKEKNVSFEIYSLPAKLRKIELLEIYSVSKPEHSSLIADIWKRKNFT